MYCNHVRYIVLGDQSLVSSYYNSEIMGDDVGRRKVSSGLGTDCGQRVLLEQCLSVNQKAIALEEDVIYNCLLILAISWDAAFCYVI